MSKYESVSIKYLDDETETFYYIDEVKIMEGNVLHIITQHRTHMIPISVTKRVTSILHDENGE